MVTLSQELTFRHPLGRDTQIIVFNGLLLILCRNSHFKNYLLLTLQMHFTRVNSKWHYNLRWTADHIVYYHIKEENVNAYS